MEATGVLLDAFGRVRDSLHRVLADLTPEELTREPHPPIGWLAWRLTRVQDSQVSRLSVGEQAWMADGWHARFGMPPDPRDFGPGLTHTREQARAFRADPDLLLGYHDALFQRMKTYLASLRPGDLDRELDEPQYDPRPTVAVRLVSVIESSLQGMGQISYLKAWHRQGGWFPREGAQPPGA